MYETCASHDRDPYRCDYLIFALDHLKAHHIAFLLLASCMYVVVVANDIDQADVEVALQGSHSAHSPYALTIRCTDRVLHGVVQVAVLLDHADRVGGRGRRRLAIGYAWMLRLARKRIVPCVNLAATATVMLSAEGKESMSAPRAHKQCTLAHALSTLSGLTDRKLRATGPAST